jgi:hypothetical protein
MFAFILNSILDGGGIIFFSVILSLYWGYCIINSENRFFQNVPVSKLYSFVNIYANVYLINFFMITLFLIFLLPLEMFFINIMDLEITEVYITPFFNNWRVIGLTASIAIIILSILLPIFFIRNNVIRKTLTILVVILSTTGIILFKYRLPVVDKIGKINFLGSIKIMNNYNEILLILVCICVVAIPISIGTSYRFYKGKRCKIQ